MRHPQILSTVEEDFRAIGLLPPLNETDDPTKPRDIPSPNPDTLDGLDDSEGDKSAHMAGAKQPKPKMGPDADDADKSGYDPDEDGGGVGAQKGPKGSYSKVAGGKDASLESMQYSKAGKQPMSAVKGKNKGVKPMIAKGLKPVKKHAGMQAENTFSKASALIEEVSGLLRSVQIDEAVDELLRSFKLVAENASLLSDRLIEVSDHYSVESVVAEMEDLSRDAVEMVDIIENELENMGDDEDEAEAVAHSSDVQEEVDSDRDPDEPYDVPSPAFKEHSEAILNVMVSKLMDAIEGYDGVLSEMGYGMGEDDGNDDHEVHVHTKAKKVHIHHGHDGEDDMEHGGQDEMGDEDPDAQGMSAHGDEDQDQDQGDMGDEGPDQDQDQDQDQGDEEGGEEDSDHDGNSLMARMKALKARREAMRGGRPFRGGHEEDESAY